MKQSRSRLCLLIGLSIIWLVPFFWAGSKQRFPFPIYKRLALQHASAALFTLRSSSYQSTGIEVRNDLFGNWVQVDSEALSPLGGFGYRQRLDRLMNDVFGKKALAEGVRQRMAVWIAQRETSFGSGNSTITAVRFVETRWPVGMASLVMPVGHWNSTPTDLPPETRRVVAATYSVIAGKATRIIEPKSPAPVAVPTPKVFQRRSS